MKCEVVVRTRHVTTRDGRVRETLERCGQLAHDFVVVKRNGIAPAYTQMCLKHARRLGDRWLCFTREYWDARVKP